MIISIVIENTYNIFDKMKYYVITSHIDYYSRHTMELSTCNTKCSIIQLIGEYIKKKNFYEKYVFGDIQIVPIYETKEDFTKTMILYLNGSESNDYDDCNYDDLLEEYTKIKNLEESEELTDLIVDIKSCTYQTCEEIDDIITEKTKELEELDETLKKLSKISKGIYYGDANFNDLYKHKEYIKDKLNIELKQDKDTDNERNYQNEFHKAKTNFIKIHHQLVCNFDNMYFQRRNLKRLLDTKNKLLNRKVMFMTVEDVIGKNHVFFDIKGVKEMIFVKYVEITQTDIEEYCLEFGNQSERFSVHFKPFTYYVKYHIPLNTLQFPQCFLVLRF